MNADGLLPRKCIISTRSFDERRQCKNSFERESRKARATESVMVADLS